MYVPLIFYGKNVEKKKTGKPVSLMSLAPTILFFINLKESVWFQGKNVFEADEYITAEAWKRERSDAYRDKEWKFVVSGNKREFYNLKEDPKEKKNLYGDVKYKERWKEFEKKINIHIKMLEKERRKIRTWL